MDHFHLAAINRPETLTPALTRLGRFKMRRFQMRGCKRIRLCRKIMHLQLKEYEKSINPLKGNVFFIEEPESHMHPVRDTSPQSQYKQKETKHTENSRYITFTLGGMTFEYDDEKQSLEISVWNPVKSPAGTGLEWCGISVSLTCEGYNGEPCGFFATSGGIGR